MIHGQMLSLNSREWPHVLSMAREIGAFFRAWGTQLYPPSWCERAKQERSRPPDAPVIEQFHHLIPATDDVLDMYEALEMTELGLVPAHTNHPRPLDGHLCQAGRSSLSVNALGEVSACEWLPVAGDVHRDSLSGLWHASETIAAMREMRARDLPECAQCDLRRWCEQCPGITVAETGSPTAASPQACRLARARRARYSGVPMV
ncbi:MAG TPA: hypothetical protein DGT21_13330 [Armatimonadetes bacterium]|nr:hypothetical protein [Armatimonadota bacterium]